MPISEYSTAASSPPARDEGWIYRLMSDRERTDRYAVKLNAGINGVFALRSSIDNGFDENGRVLFPLVVRITGNTDGVTELFTTGRWTVTPRDGNTTPYELLLTVIM